MKKILLMLMVVIALISCGNNQGGDVRSNTNSHKDEVEILYFHGKQRCVTCNAIEKLTRDVITENFAKELKDGRLTFKVVDISIKENEHIAEKYEVSWSSLFVNKWKEGREQRNDMTKLGFSQAKNSPEVFKEGVKAKIQELFK